MSRAGGDVEAEDIGSEQQQPRDVGRLQGAGEPERYPSLAASHGEGVEPRRAAVVWRPQTSIAVDDEAGEKILKLVGALEDNDDVQTVYANFEVSDALMARR